jgi:hypothetical protein
VPHEVDGRGAARARAVVRSGLPRRCRIEHFAELTRRASAVGITGAIGGPGLGQPVTSSG